MSLRFEDRPQLGQRLVIGDDGYFGLEFGNLLGQQLDVAPGH